WFKHKGGKVFQSSTYNALGDPENAIDGSITVDYMRGHCSHTELEVQPWWTVDLTAKFQVSRVSITNRGDCCAERLNGAQILIGNSPEKGGITNPRCATIRSLGQGKTAVFDCGEMQGQYVTVTIPGVRMLTLCEVQVFGTKVISSVRNVAINGQASQSSSYNSLSSPAHAIDGSTASNYLLAQCTHTSKESNPWWMVDLRARFRVLSIVVTNRGDCCEERIRGAEIRIGDSKDRGGTANPRCAIITSLGLGETGKYECDEMSGQYVTITIPQRNSYLSLCEVQVYGQRIIPPVRNVAYDGKAYESSSFNSLSVPEHAIDGSTAANYLRGHCTHTKLEVNPWWMVDLRARFRVLSVVVTNRGDCCEERLDGAVILIGDSKDRGGITNPRCATITSLRMGETHKFECNEMPGQYVTITIPDRSNYLSVCEVQVFGERIIPPVPNVALKGKAFQSSLYHKLGLAEHAIDGSTAVDYYRQSCTHTELEMNPWWMVDLEAEFSVASVSISNREDCCADRLNGAQILIGNSVENGGLKNPRCAVITAIGAGETENFDCKGMKGRYVTVTIPSVQYLTLCEVQVFGVRVDSSGE
uniref:Fucolectin tachylectin-4 pentraxin-1 domain-containing protein n=2 Tax=Anolis carolinensis TaxID=28377 RepID=R4GDI2_ANOCA